MSVYIKKFEWKISDKTVLKIESVNSYLDTVTETKNFGISRNMLLMYCVDNGDMEYDMAHNELILLDNTDYWVTYDKACGKINQDILNDILDKRIDNRGILNSKNYVGVLDIGINTFSITVQSRKTNYERDFNFLRNSINEFCTDLLSRSSSYYSAHFRKNDDYVDEKINYSEIAYLKDMLSPDKFPAWIDFFLYNAEHKYKNFQEEDDLSEITDLNPDNYLNALSAGNVFKTSKLRGRAGSYGYAPIRILTDKCEITYDTNENRFVKFYLFYLSSYIKEIIEKVDSNNGKLIRELEKMGYILDEKTENPFWNNISDSLQIPYNSQVLQKKYPYNQIYQMYTEFMLKSNLNTGDIDKTFLAGQKDAPMLYQYWVFIMLFKYLSKKYNDSYTVSDWISYDGKNLTVTLIEGQECNAIFKTGQDTELHLLYNKTYDSSHSVWAGRSYSHELKPDMSLELFKNDELTAVLHFDAKYRLPINGTDVPDDINKMHAYKDAIMGSVGAYAICLADRPVLYIEEEKGFTEGEIFPSVGTCPLTLNPVRLNQELDYIYYIIDEFTKISCDNTVNKFSEIRLKKYHSLFRQMMEVGD